MDYGFAPSFDEDKAIKSIRDYFKIRGIEIEGDTPYIDNIEGFLSNLAKKHGAEHKPIDIWIACHGGVGGISLKLSGTSNKKLLCGRNRFATYDCIEEAIKTSSLLIPVSLNVPAIHFICCRMGSSQKYLDKLKEAFRDVKVITAPKHRPTVHAEYNPFGYFQYMRKAYDFFSLEEIKDRKILIKGFKEKYKNSVPKVPEDSWEKWIPKNEFNKIGFQAYCLQSFSLKGEVKNMPKISFWGDFLHDCPLPILPIIMKVGVDIDPKNVDVDPRNNHKEKMEIMKNLMKKDKRFNNNPKYFPFWEQKGYIDFDSFFKGYKWTFQLTKDKNKIICSGTRYTYSIGVPLTKPDGSPLFNFYPSEQGIARGYTKFIGMKEDDLLCYGRAE